MAAMAEINAIVMPYHLSPNIAASRLTVPPSERILDSTETVVRIDQPVTAAMQHLERTMMQYALRLSGGRVEEAAKMLGLARKGLSLKRLWIGRTVGYHQGQCRLKDVRRRAATEPTVECTHHALSCHWCRGWPSAPCACHRRRPANRRAEYRASPRSRNGRPLASQRELRH